MVQVKYYYIHSLLSPYFNLVIIKLRVIFTEREKVKHCQWA